jgi:hypothetical protein
LLRQPTEHARALLALLAFQLAGSSNPPLLLAHSRRSTLVPKSYARYHNPSKQPYRRLDSPKAVSALGLSKRLCFLRIQNCKHALKEDFETGRPPFGQRTFSWCLYFLSSEVQSESEASVPTRRLQAKRSGQPSKKGPGSLRYPCPRPGGCPTGSMNHIRRATCEGCNSTPTPLFGRKHKKMQKGKRYRRSLLF